MKSGTLRFFWLILLHAVRLVQAQTFVAQVKQTLKPYIIEEGAWALKQAPVTITSKSCSRSAGGKHDFYSEGDYWWPDPQHPDSPYVQRDGMTNPENFTTHRLLMIRFSRIMGALGTAYKVTGNKAYAQMAARHLNAWFINQQTLMHPNLLYSQAIKGRATGRGIGVIDAIQLMEVARATQAMQKVLNNNTITKTKQWFAQYLSWVTTHQYGLDEMNAKNNHGTCWVMQVACFAQFTGNKRLMDLCRQRYKEVLLPGQMAADGSFPLELKRTKPYGYSIFDLDAMCTICQLLSVPGDDLWHFSTTGGQSIAKGISFLYPYLKNKQKWPGPHDIMYWDEWPVAQPSLVFGAVALKQQNWLDTWKKLNHHPQNEEVIRNLPVRHPLLWLN